MKYVGVDLHKHLIVLCVVVLVGNRPRVAKRARFRCEETDAIRAFFQGLGRFQVVVEATAAYEWFFLLIENMADRLMLAHPKKLRVIAESTRKSDKIDSEVLGVFLAQGMIPQAYRPTPRVRQHRVLVRHRCWLQRRITSLKCKIRNVLGHYNADIAGLFTRKGKEHLAQVPLSPAERFTVEALEQQLSLFQSQLKEADRQRQQFAETGPLAELEARALLDSIPWIGPVTIDVVLSELGDWRRFHSQKAASAYAGLDPGYRQSADTRRELHISKAGSPLLRWAMIQAAWRLVMHSSRWRAMHWQLEGNTGSKKKAIVGVARHLLEMMLAILQSGRPYEVLGVPNHNQRPSPSCETTETSAPARQKGAAPSRRRPRLGRSRCATGRRPR